jgi:hypothetical protein
VRRIAVKIGTREKGIKAVVEVVAGQRGRSTAWLVRPIVESAIEYIKQLKKEVDDANERARVAEKKVRMSDSSGGNRLD